MHWTKHCSSQNGMYFLSLGILLLVLHGSERVQSCCTPDQWEGVESAIIGTVRNGQAQVGNANVRVHYDYTNLRVAAFTNVTNEFGTFQILILQLYSNPTSGLQYVYNMVSKNCEKSTLTTPFEKGCIPDDAVKLRDLSFGFGRLGIAAVEYQIRVPDQPQTQVILSVTSDTCVPVTEVVSGIVTTSLGEESMMQAVEFSNIKGGISSTDVFNIPQECNTVSFPTQHVNNVFSRLNGSLTENKRRVFSLYMQV